MLLVVCCVHVRFGGRAIIIIFTFHPRTSGARARLWKLSMRLALTFYSYTRAGEETHTHTRAEKNSYEPMLLAARRGTNEPFYWAWDWNFVWPDDCDSMRTSAPTCSRASSEARPRPLSRFAHLHIHANASAYHTVEACARIYSVCL